MQPDFKTMWELLSTRFQPKEPDRIIQCATAVGYQAGLKYCVDQFGTMKPEIMLHGLHNGLCDIIYSIRVNLLQNGSANDEAIAKLVHSTLESAFANAMTADPGEAIVALRTELKKPN